MLKDWPKGSVACVVCRTDDPYRKEVPGSIEIDCWQCGHKCMITAATFDRTCKMGDTTVICVHCARAYYDASGVNMEVLPPTKEQEKEGASFGRKHLIG
jgi:hypothetical protein